MLLKRHAIHLAAALTLGAPACRSGAPSGQAVTEGVTPAAKPGPNFGASTHKVGCAVCYAHAWENGGRGGYGTETSKRMIGELAQLGIRRLSLTPFGWMSSLDQGEIKWASNGYAAENHARLRKANQNARAQQVEVMLKPHIWVRGGEWRAHIAPSKSNGGWPAWFSSYERFILAYAKLAEELDVAWFVVGVELRSSMIAHPERWRALIVKVRQVYRGKLTYAANWDRAEHLPIWDALDAVGVQMFAPLAKTEGALASPAALKASAKRWLDRFVALADRVGKPLLITEAGLINRVGSTVKPYLWPEHLGDVARSPRGDAEQLAGYQALMQTFGRSPRVIGLYWWKWFSTPDARDEEPVGFSPRGKPAGVWLAKVCRAAPLRR